MRRLSRDTWGDFALQKERAAFPGKGERRANNKCRGNSNAVSPGKKAPSRVSLPWIKLFTDLPDHPKADVLGSLLSDPRGWTYMVQLWLWTARMRPTGQIGDLPPEMVARRAGWVGDAAQFMAAIRGAGFLDEDGSLHGWDETQKPHAERLQRDAERARKRRADVVRTSTGRNADAEPTSAERRSDVVWERRGEEIRGDEKRGDQDHGGASAPASKPPMDPTKPVWAQRVEPLGMYGAIPADIGEVWAFQWRGEDVAIHLKRAAPDLDETARWDQTEDCLNYRAVLSDRDFKHWGWPQGCLPRLIGWLERANKTHLDAQTARARAAKAGVYVADTKRSAR